MARPEAAGRDPSPPTVPQESKTLMRFACATVWMPTLRRSGISALMGRSVPSDRARVVYGVQSAAVMLKEGET